MKHFACGSVVAGCRAEFSAPDEETLLGQVAAHARDDHGLSEITPELVDAVRQHITTRAA